MLAITLVAVAALVAGAVGIFANWVPKPTWAEDHPYVLLAALFALVVGGAAAAWLAENPQEPELAFTSPGDGTLVGDTFEASGVASGLDEGEELWLLVVGGNSSVPGTVYYRYQETPLRISEDKWSARLTSLGEPGDSVGEPYTLALVRADAGCSRALAELAPNSNGETFFQDPAPQGCELVPDELTVRKG